MTTPADRVEAIRGLGYNEPEVLFLYLVAIHSGHFTNGQFLRFSQQTKSSLAHRFTARTLEKRDVRALEFGRKTQIFNLYSRRIYAVIGRDNLRAHRRLSNDLIHTRLLILDFVLAHLTHAYLETEGEKVAYFHEQLGIPLSVLPGRIYRGLKSNGNTMRYFVDRSPVFVAREGQAPSSPIPTFVYCDPATRNLTGFTAHLGRYRDFLRCLPEFNFIYASPESDRFGRAGRRFALSLAHSQPATPQVLRYFQVRQLWESHKTSSLTRADRDLLRGGYQQYRGEPFESAYLKWAAGTLPEAELAAFLGVHQPAQKRNFSTCVLPESYTIFHRESHSPLRPSTRLMDRLSAPPAPGPGHEV
jgi:hypothetical protein